MILHRTHLDIFYALPLSLRDLDPFAFQLSIYLTLLSPCSINTRLVYTLFLFYPPSEVSWFNHLDTWWEGRKVGYKYSCFSCHCWSQASSGWLLGFTSRRGDFKMKDFLFKLPNILEA